MKILKGFLCLALIMATNGCSNGDLRAFNDAISEQNGYSVSYPDETYTDWVGDVKIVYGVKSGEGFFNIKNASDDYCRVRVYLEDEDYNTYNITPGQSTGSRYMSLYNWLDYFRVRCHNTRDVFRVPFD
jgi:hypothetical protein